jgi:serine/threonine-protein kinase
MLGASWGTPDQIVISLNTQIAIVPATGGAPRIVGQLDSAAGETQQRWPFALPDGKTALYTSWPSAGWSSARIGVMSLKTGKTRVLDLVGSHAVAVLDGRLVYASASSAIMAVPFNEGTQRISGTPAPVIDQVFVGSGGPLKGAVSRTGALVYVSGSATQQVVIASRGAPARVLIAAEKQYSYPRLSPDGKRLAITIGGGSGSDVWIYEIASGTTQKLTSGGAVNERPEWSPDGKRVLFRSDRETSSSVYSQPADLSGAVELVYRNKTLAVYEVEMSRDGKWVVMRVDGPGSPQDIWYRAVTGDTVAKPLVTGPSAEYGARFSPDGKWVAYSSNESGANQVYVTPFPGPGAKHLVSTNGGITPLWTGDGRRLVYANGQQILSATLSLQPSFAVVARDTLLDGLQGNGVFNHANFDISPDAKQILLLKSISDNAQVIVVHDWKYELQARMATAGKQ